MWKFKGENIGEQVFLNAVDKLVFSALLIAIATILTTCQQRSERSLMQAEKVIAIHVERPMAITEELSGPIRQLISLTKGAENVGFTKEEAATVRSLALEIETLLDVLQAYANSEDVANAISETRELTVGFSTKVSMGTIQALDFPKFTEDLREGFVRLSTAVLAHTTDEIHKDSSR